MIHYHGSPVSGPRDCAQRFYSARHLMVSYAHPEHLPMIADVAQSFALDNGAYTTWTKGREFDFDGFVSWVELWRWHPGFDWCLAPDVIDGDEKRNDQLLWKFVDRFGMSPWIVPVWHLHESLTRLGVLAGAFCRVALGSSGQYRTPGTPTWKARMAEAMSVVCNEGRPICKLHGLRMLDGAIVERYPFSSADSCNAAVNAGAVTRFGMYPSPLAADRANSIAARIESNNSPPVWVPAEETEERLFA